LHGYEVRRAADGRLAIDAPGYSRDGAITPVVELPEELQDAIGREIAGMI
jgi:hypothetical protein